MGHVGSFCWVALAWDGAIHVEETIWRDNFNILVEHCICLDALARRLLFHTWSVWEWLRSWQLGFCRLANWVMGVGNLGQAQGVSEPPGPLRRPWRSFWLSKPPEGSMRRRGGVEVWCEVGCSKKREPSYSQLRHLANFPHQRLAGGEPGHKAVQKACRQQES